MKTSTKLLIGVAAIVVAVGISIACTKNNNQTSDNGEKNTPCDHEVACYFWNDPQNDPICKNCVNVHLCYISYGCIDSVDIGIEPDPGTGPGKGGNIESKYYIIIPQYASVDESVQLAFENFFDEGVITFTEDCPADTPKLYDLLPDGWLPAGTYPISKHGDDAWIDITSAVAI